MKVIMTCTVYSWINEATEVILGMEWSDGALQNERTRQNPIYTSESSRRGENVSFAVGSHSGSTINELRLSEFFIGCG